MRDAARVRVDLVHKRVDNREAVDDLALGVVVAVNAVLVVNEDREVPEWGQVLVQPVVRTPTVKAHLPTLARRFQSRGWST